VILQTAKESCKAFTYGLCDLLVYLNLYIWRICFYYEFVHECKFTQYCINQNPPLNLLLTARIKSTPPNLQTAKESSKGTPRMHFCFHRGINCARHKCNGHKHNEVSEKSLSKGMQHAGLKRWCRTIYRSSLEKKQKQTKRWQGDLQKKEASSFNFEFCVHGMTNHGCGLRKTTRSPKVPNYKILGAQHLSLDEKVSFSTHPKAKVSHLRYPGTSRAQPCQFTTISLKNVHAFFLRAGK